MAHVKIKHGDWVFVGDGRKALLLRNDGDPGLLDLRRVEVREDNNPPSREQGSDGPGRSGVNIGPRSAIDTTDWHALEEERFAAAVAQRLNRAAESARRIAPGILKEAAGQDTRRDRQGPDASHVPGNREGFGRARRVNHQLIGVTSTDLMLTNSSKP